MAQIPQDVIANVSEEDIKTIQTELGKSGSNPDVGPSPTQKAVEEASTEASSETTGTKASEEETSVKTEVSKPASEGEKSPSTEIIPKTRERSKTVPYERFKEVNDALKKAQAELSQIRSTSAPTPNELDEYGQPDIKKLVSNEVVNKVKEVLEPIITSLDEEREQQELKQALEKYPEAEKYLKEIKAYANATNLVYDDIVALVLAKHSRPVSLTEKKQAEAEAQEAELSGQSNSTAKRRTPTIQDIKNLSTEELEKLIDLQ
ncbi:MAG: hypothetical protein QW076_00310 [Candidatus Anstonellales archaeon]